MRPEDKIWLNSQIKNMVNKKYTQEMTPAERVKGGASALPVVGDAISGYDAYQSAKQGDYLGAALNAVGLLPMIPALAGIVKAKNINSISDISSLFKDSDNIFVRWSAGPKYDMEKGKVSRDFVSGANHSGLSAVPLDKSMDPEDLAKYVKEYSFLRLGNDVTNKKNIKIKPHFYEGNVVGRDSDGYASIAPTKYLGTGSDFLTKQLDSGLADKLRLTREIEEIKGYLSSWKGDEIGRSIVEGTLSRKINELSKIK